MKTAKVKEIKAVRAWTGGSKPMWFFTVEMDNGDKGDVTRFQENGLRVGDELTYKIEQSGPNGQYTKLAEERKSGKFGGGGAKQSNASIALNAATQLAAANVTANGSPLKLDELGPKVLGLADVFHRWLEGK